MLESSRAYRFPPFAAQLRPPLDPEAAGAPGTVPAEASLLTIDNTDIVLSTVKPAEAGDGFIVRLVNPSSMTCEASVEFGGVLAGRIETVVLCDLKEDASNMAEGLLLDRGVLKLTFRGGEIKTLKLLLSRKNSS